MESLDSNNIYIYLGRRGGINDLTLVLANNSEESKIILSVYNDQLSKYKTPFTIRTFRTWYSFIINSILFLPINLIKINRYIKKHYKARSRVVFTGFHYWNLFFILMLYKNFEVEVFVHDYKSHSGERNIVIDMMQKWIISLKEVYITVLSKHEMDLVKSKRTERILLKPINNFFTFTNEECPPLDVKDNVNLLFFGRIIKYKGFEKIPSICETLKLLNMNNFKIVIRGEGDNNIKQFLRKNIDLETHDVKFGWADIEEINKIIKGNTIVVLPYDEATQSGIVPQVIALRGYLIYTDVGALSEQAGTYDRAYCSSGLTGKEIANSVVKILK